MKQFERKFPEDYKNSVKEVYEKEGLDKAFEFVKKDFPSTTNRTIKSWVDGEYGQRVKNNRNKSYQKAKETDPERVKSWQETSYQNDKERRKSDQELRKKRIEHSKKWDEQSEPRLKELGRKRWKTDENVRKRSYERRKRRKESDFGFKLRENARSRAYGLLKTALNGKPLKHCSTLEFFGCTLDFLKDHLRARYKPGMTDGNYGKEWHLDHIKPCSLFDLTDKVQFKECWHYSNLQPLWAHESIAKSNKYEPPTKIH